MTDLPWQKKTPAGAFGADRGLPDRAGKRVAKFRPEVLDELRRNEREAVPGALGRVARQSRDARRTDFHSGDKNKPAFVEGDIDWGLRAARSALEAQPAGERSEKANELLGECTCPAATGPNPGRDTSMPGTQHE